MLTQKITVDVHLWFFGVPWVFW